MDYHQRNAPNHRTVSEQRDKVREQLSDSVTLYLGDCRDILPTLGKVDAVVTDPPYNSGIKYGEGTNDNRLDYWEWLQERIMLFWDNADAILIKHSALKIAQFLEDWPSSRVLVWTKPFSSGFPHRGFMTHWEPLHLLKGSAENPGKDYVEIAAGPATSKGDPWSGHPAQMPVDLAAWAIERLSSRGKTILDPFMGSGTTGVAAVSSDRGFIGIEIEPKYFDIACRRISDELKRPRLPLEAPQKQTQEALPI